MNDDFEKRIAQYVALRDNIKKCDDDHKAAMEPKRKALEMLEGYLLTMLNKTGQDHAGTKAGTAYVKSEVSATIADPQAFRRYVIGGEKWDMIDWRANKVAVNDLVSETGEPPPGVNYSKTRIVRVRRPGNKED